MPCTRINVKDCQLPEDILLNERTICDLELVLNGGYAPLNGFMTADQYVSCMDDMKIEVDGKQNVWTLPVNLPVSMDQCKWTHGDSIDLTYEQYVAAGVCADDAGVTKTVNLRDPYNTLLATLCVSSIYVPDLAEEMKKVLNEDNCDAPTHPYGKYLAGNHKNCVYLGGVVTKVTGIEHWDFQEFRLTPAEAKARIAERPNASWCGFQTRNPMHRSHFELTVNSLNQITEETSAPCHLMLTPAVGPTQPGDIDYRIRVRCYEAILEHYKHEPLLVLLPLAMRMAGPREAVHHAIIRQNYGCTHFIVGRDHAGPFAKRSDGTSFYGPYDAHLLMEKVCADPSITIKPVLGTNMLYCGEQHGYVQEVKLAENAEKGLVPTKDSVVAQISGTKFREMLQKGEDIPSWFCFPNVAKELARSVPKPHERGLCVYFTGLPCSGKSTLSNALQHVLLANPKENRQVTILDADIIRRHLSKGLGFSKEDRSLNVRRIGYVASEIVKHGGICLVANIAPFQEDRDANRKLIEGTGGVYFECYVSTTLDVCETRDIKQFYKKARAGIIKSFTGINDPYEIPENPELIVNSDNDLSSKVQGIYSHLCSLGYVQN